MTKEDIKLLENDEDEVFFASEELAFEWIEMFLSDVNRVERFFVEKKEQLINDFIAMQERYRLKSYSYQDKKKTKFKNKLSDAAGKSTEPLLLEVKNEMRASMPDDGYFDREQSFMSDGREPSMLAASRASMHTIRYSEIEKAAPKAMAKFNTKEDLLKYAEMKTGKRELTTFLIPDIQEVHNNIRLKR